MNLFEICHNCSSLDLSTWTLTLNVLKLWTSTHLRGQYDISERYSNSKLQPIFERRKREPNFHRYSRKTIAPKAQNFSHNCSRNNNKYFVITEFVKTYFFYDMFIKFHDISMTFPEKKQNSMTFPWHSMTKILFQVFQVFHDMYEPCYLHIHVVYSTL